MLSFADEPAAFAGPVPLTWGEEVLAIGVVPLVVGAGMVMVLVGD